MRPHPILCMHTLGCHVTLTQGYGIIESPAYGVADYNNNLECTWTIVEAQGRGVTLVFEDFTTEKTYDNVKVTTRLQRNQ